MLDNIVLTHLIGNKIKSYKLKTMFEKKTAKHFTTNVFCRTCFEKYTIQYGYFDFFLISNRIILIFLIVHTLS